MARLLLWALLLLASLVVARGALGNPGTRGLGASFACSGSATYTYCVKGTFAMQTSGGLLGLTPSCTCFACPPGTHRSNLAVTDCTACGDQRVCTTTSEPPAVVPPGMCSYFQYNPGSLQAILNDYDLYGGRILVGGSRITANSFYALLSTEIFGGMREARNALAPCGSLHISNPPNPSANPVVAMAITASPPNLVDQTFSLTNPGSLPVNITLSLPRFASVVDSNYVALSPSNGNNRLAPGTTNFRLQIDTSRLEAPYLFANESGAAFEVVINSYQSWLTAPIGAPLVYLPVNRLQVALTLSTELAVLVTPTLIDFGTVDSSAVSSRVLKLYNMFPGQLDWTAAIVYGDVANTPNWLTLQVGSEQGDMNMSASCLANMVQIKPLAEYTDELQVTADARDLSAGLYQTRIRVTARNIDTLVTARITVIPGVANFAKTKVAFGSGIERSLEAVVDISQSTDLLLMSVDDYGTLTTMNFPDEKDGSEFAFNVTWYAREDPNTPLGSVRANYESNGVWRARPFVDVVGLYNLSIHETTTQIAVEAASALSLEVVPINCASYSATSINMPDGTCGCISGYGVANREGAFYVSCEPCPPGTRAVGPASTSTCVACPAGTANGEFAQTECATCPMNEGVSVVELKHSDFALRPLTVGSAVDIDTDTFTMESSLDFSKCETCAKDAYLDPVAKVCLPCPSDKKPRRVVKSMTRLADGAVAEANSTSLAPTFRYSVEWRVECMCRYNAFAVNNSCAPCPPGAFCAFKTAETLLPLHGFWQEPFNSESFTSCRQASSCPGVQLDSTKGILDDYLVKRELAYLRFVNASRYQALAVYQADASLAECPRGAFTCDVGYSGPLCYKCTAGFTRDGLNGCQDCIESGVLTFVIILGILIALVITIWIVRKAYVEARDNNGESGARGRELQMLKLIVSYLQEMSMSSAYALSWPAWVLSVFQIFNVISSAGQSLFSVGCLMEPTYRFCPPTIQNVTSNVETLGVFDTHRTTTFFYEALFLACIPVAWGFVAGAFWLYMYTKERAVNGKRRGKSTINYFILSIICLLFILYPSLSLSALKFFSCSAEDLSGNSLRFLEADANIVCFGLTHVKWLATLGIVMLVLYALGTPLTLFYVLYHHHSNSALSKYRATFGFVFTGYKARFYYWECVIMARKLAFSCVAVLMAPLGTDLQAYAGLLVIVVFLQLQTALQPFEDPVLNTAESAGLQARFLTLMLGVMLDSENSGYTFIILCGSFIIVINALFLLYTLRILIQATIVASREVGLVKAIGLDQALSWMPGSQRGWGSVRRLDGSAGGSNGRGVSVADLRKDVPSSSEENFEFVSPIVANELRHVSENLGSAKVADENPAQP